MQTSRLWKWMFVSAAMIAAAGVWRMGSSPALADRAALAPPCCVGVLNLNTVLEALDERKTLESELQEFISKQETNLKDMQAKVQQAEADLKILPEKSKDWFKKRDETALLAARFRAEQEVAKALVEDQRKRMHLSLFTKINEAAARYAKTQGFAVVITDDSGIDLPAELPEQQLQGAMVNRRVTFADPSLDISQGVSQMMNNEFKAR